MRAAVLDTGTLEPVSVEIVSGEGGSILRVTVEDKWSIFPIPLVMISSGVTSFGLVFADTNAFGIRDMAAAGGIYSSDGWTGIVTYRHAPNQKGFPGWNALFAYNRLKVDTQDENETSLRIYEKDYLRSSFGLEYPVFEYTTLSFNIAYSDNSITSARYNAPESNRILRFTPGLSLRYSHWDGYLLSERNFSLSYGYGLALLGKSYHEIIMRTAYAFPLVPGFVFNARGVMILTPEGGALAERGPRYLQIDILPSKFSALHYGGAQLGLEKYLLKTRIGTLSFVFSWQAVMFSGGAVEEGFAHGPSGGLRFYLSRLAIPALGFNLACNVLTLKPQFSFSLGMSF